MASPELAENKGFWGVCKPPPGGIRTPCPGDKRKGRRKSPATELGTVEAPDAESAIKRAIEVHRVTDREQQKRLAAHRIG
jgi:hypothetical protein